MTIIVSDINEGPVVNIAAWLGTIVMVSAVCSRLWSKYSILRRWTLDDAVIVVAMLLGCLVTATISMAVVNGLGQTQSSLSDRQITGLQKLTLALFGYASQLIYLPALCLTKLTTLVYLRALSPDSRFGTISMCSEIFVILYGLACEFAIAFQCQPPSTWAIISGKCFDTAAFWKANGAIDILTDVMLVLLPLYLVWSLQMPWNKKGVVLIAFGTRILIIPLTVWRISSLSTASSRNLTPALYYGYLTTTIQLNFAIFMTCVAFMRPFLQTMVSGGMAATVHSATPSYRNNSGFSSYLSSRSDNRASKVKPSYKMENLSEEGLFESTVDESESNGNCSYTTFPSRIKDKVQFAPTKAVSHGEFGPLRSDTVLNSSRVSNPPLEERKARSDESTEMGIMRTTKWEVEEERKCAIFEGRDYRR